MPQGFSTEREVHEVCEKERRKKKKMGKAERESAKNEKMED